MAIKGIIKIGVLSMRRILHKILDPLLSVIAKVLLNRTNIPKDTERNGQGLRMLAAQRLRELYTELLPDAFPAGGLMQYESHVFSQGGEDGILLHIFSRIGVKNRTFIEFGAESGRECNTANLSINFGWSGLLMDGSEANVKLGRKFLNAHLGPRADDVKFIRAWITTGNIQKLIREHGVSDSTDLLSIDIDGNDYWVWKTIDIISPSVVLIEYNAAYGPTRSLTIPYDPRFRWKHNPQGLNRGFYFGASLTALTKLAKQKGYALVGCSSSGVNAFYVRRDLLGEGLIELSPEQAFVPQFNRVVLGISTEEQFGMIKHLDFVEV